MENNRTSLREVIEGIRRTLEIRLQKNFTAEEIVQKINVSESQLHAYLNGEEEVPDMLISNLIASHDIKVSTVQLIVEERFYLPPEGEAESEE